MISTAQEMGITVENEELQQGADRLRLLYGLTKAADTFSWLEKYHLSVDQFEELVYINILNTKLAQHLFGDRIEPFFVEHLLDYTQVVFYEVVINDPDLAIELFLAMQEGEMTFQQVAGQYSQTPELQRMGGYRGKVPRISLHPEISAAVFAATPPQVLKPIQTNQGHHLILIEEIIQPQLNDQIRSEILSHLFNSWLKQQIQQVEICYAT
jgi:parvulin-like peptidyl-prolyl isomerase